MCSMPNKKSATERLHDDYRKMIKSKETKEETVDDEIIRVHITENDDGC